MPGRLHSRDFTLSVCRQIASGERRPAQACREHGLAESLLLRWRKEYRGRGEAVFGPHQSSEPEALAQKVAELERFCGQLALENAVLKCGCIRASVIGRRSSSKQPGPRRGKVDLPTGLVQGVHSRFAPVFLATHGGPGRIRTCDQEIMSPPL